jgi:glutamate-ammonia-ligase adenylyltransferase
MRARIAAAKGQDGPLDAKYGPGRLMDIDLAAQTCALLAASPARGTEDQIAAGVATGLLPVADGAALTAAYRLFWAMQASARLLIGGTMTADNLGTGARAMLLRDTGVADLDGLAARASAAAAQAAVIIDRLLTP